MAYTLPTPATLKAHFPAFADVADSVVQFHLDRGARMVDTSWTEGDYATAIELLACHYMTAAGLGTGAEAEINAQGMGGFSVIKSGQLTLERGRGAGSGDGSGIPEEFAGSVYGRQFYALLRVNKPTVAVAGGAATVPAVGYVVGGWPGVVWPGWPY